MRLHLGLVLALAVSTCAATAAIAQTTRERGEYLVNAVAACGNCHTPKDAKGLPVRGAELTGGVVFDEPKLGYVIGSNITPDPATGIGNWTTGQIVYLLHNGKRPDGSIVGPPMPFNFYRGISDRDADAIAVYLKSRPGVHNEVPRSQFVFPLPPSYGPTVAHVDAPDTADKVAYGGYLAGPVAHCMECHTPRQGPHLETDRMGVGGRELADRGNSGAMVVSRNITPDPEFGIGKWSDADVKRAILVGKRPDGTQLTGPMPYEFYNKMSSDDVNAIVAYLRSLPPLH